MHRGPFIKLLNACVPDVELDMVGSIHISVPTAAQPEDT